jgi:hypothetical protein
LVKCFYNQNPPPPPPPPDPAPSSAPTSNAQTIPPAPAPPPPSNALVAPLSLAPPMTPAHRNATAASSAPPSQSRALPIVTRTALVIPTVSFLDQAAAETRKMATLIAPSETSLHINPATIAYIQLTPLKFEGDPVYEHNDPTGNAVSAALAISPPFKDKLAVMKPENGLSFMLFRAKDAPIRGFFFKAAFKTHSSAIPELQNQDWRARLCAVTSLEFMCPSRDRESRKSRIILTRLDVRNPFIAIQVPRSLSSAPSPSTLLPTDHESIPNISAFAIFQADLLANPIRQIAKVLESLELSPNVDWIACTSIPKPATGSRAAVHTKQLSYSIPIPRGTSSTIVLAFLRKLTVAHFRGFPDLSSTLPFSAYISFRLHMIFDLHQRTSLPLGLQFAFKVLLEEPEFKPLALKKSKVSKGLYHEGSSATSASEQSDVGPETLVGGSAAGSNRAQRPSAFASAKDSSRSGAETESAAASDAKASSVALADAGSARSSTADFAAAKVAAGAVIAFDANAALAVPDQAAADLAVADAAQTAADVIAAEQAAAQQAAAEQATTEAAQAATDAVAAVQAAADQAAAQAAADAAQAAAIVAIADQAAAIQAAAEQAAAEVALAAANAAAAKQAAADQAATQAAADAVQTAADFAAAVQAAADQVAAAAILETKTAAEARAIVVIDPLTAQAFATPSVKPAPRTKTGSALEPNPFLSEDGSFDPPSASSRAHPPQRSAPPPVSTPNVSSSLRTSSRAPKSSASSASKLL